MQQALRTLIIVSAAPFRCRAEEEPMKGDRVEIVIDAGGSTRTYDIEATRAGRRGAVTHRPGGGEGTQTAPRGAPRRTARVMAGAGLAAPEAPSPPAGPVDPPGGPGHRPAA